MTLTLTEQWWAAADQRHLLIQRCDACDHHQHYPRTVCTGCGADTPAWVVASGTGVVDSFTVVHRAPGPDIAVPYVVARVRLAEGPVVLTHLVDAPSDSWRCDEPVRLDWRPRGEGGWLPVFRRTEQTGT